MKIRNDVDLRWMTDSDEDAELVTRWRNDPMVRPYFFSEDVVTPDTHRLFMKNRKPHDLVWVIEHRGCPVGMCSLTVDVEKREAEFGRILVDPGLMGKGYARKAVHLALYYAFKILQLNRVWIEAFEENNAILSLYRSLGFNPCEDKSSYTWAEKRVVVWELLSKEWTSWE